MDNFPTRFLLNDACVLAGKTLVRRRPCLRLIGLAMTVKGGETACYRCLFPEPPPPAGVVSCSEAGVLGPIPGVIGAHPGARGHQGASPAPAGRCTTGCCSSTAREMSFREVEVERAPTCPVCGAQPTITELRDEEVV